MQTLSLKLSTSSNRALNSDGVTLLRSLSLVQGETYRVNLSFLDGSSPVVPDISTFSFFLRTSAGADLVAVDSVTFADGGYYFILETDSPALASALGSSSFADVRGVVSWAAGGEIDVIEPFAVRVYSTQSTGAVSYVSRFNNLTGAVTLAGAGGITITESGQTVTVSGGSEVDLSAYLLRSESGAFASQAALAALTSQTGSFALKTALEATGTALAGSIAVLLSQTGSYVLTSQTGTFATALNLAASGATLQSQINSLVAATGGYYPRSNPSGYISAIPSDVVRTTGNQTISGTKTFALAAGVFSGDGSRLTGIPSAGGGAYVSLTGNQIVSGVKTFYNRPKMINGLEAPFVWDSNGNPSVNVDAHYLQGAQWYLTNGANSAPINADVILQTTGMLTNDHYNPAVAAHMDIAFNYFGGNGQNITVGLNGVGPVTVYVYDNYEDASNSGNSPYIVFNGDWSTFASELASLLNMYLGGSYATNSANLLTLTGAGTGASDFVSFSSWFYTAQYYGQDASGINNLTLANGSANVLNILEDVTLFLNSDASWGGDIELGYFEGDSWISICFWSYSQLVANNTILTLAQAQFNYLQFPFYNDISMVGKGLKIRTSTGNTTTSTIGTAVPEGVGSPVLIRARINQRWLYTT